MAAPTTGACADWITAADVFDCKPCSDVDGQNLVLAAEVVDVATDLLYRLSDRRYPGLCTATVRPCSRLCQSPGRGCGCARLDELKLGVDYPVTAIGQVRVDGVVLVAGTDYRVDDFAWLVNINGDGWPGCQDLTLAATAVDTWEVQFTYGRAPSAPAQLAAKTLACEFYQACAGADCKLPSRVRSIVRQGVEVGFIDPQEFIAEGRTGLYPVDLFLSAERYDASHMGTVIASPDLLPQTRRVGT